MVHLQTRIMESCSFYYALCTWWKEAGRKEKYKNVAHSNSKIFQPCLFLYSPKHITAAVFYFSALPAPSIQSHEQQCQAVTAGSCKLPLFCSVYRQPFLFSLSQQVMQQYSMWIDMKGWTITTQNRRQLLISFSFIGPSLQVMAGLEKK